MQTDLPTEKFDGYKCIADRQHSFNSAIVIILPQIKVVHSISDGGCEVEGIGGGGCTVKHQSKQRKNDEDKDYVEL